MRKEYLHRSAGARRILQPQVLYSGKRAKSGGGGAGAKCPPGHDVDDASEACRENKPIIISGNMTEFEFDRVMQTSKISKKRKL